MAQARTLSSSAMLTKLARLNDDVPGRSGVKRLLLVCCPVRWRRGLIARLGPGNIIQQLVLALDETKMFL